MLHSDTTITVGKADHQSRLYTFSHFAPNISPTALLTHLDGVSKLWHEQFGHLNYRYLEQLSRQDMVIGLPCVHFSYGVFHGFIIGKHIEEKYDKGKSWRVKQVLELVHSDVLGPFLNPSFNRTRYLLTLIDDFSRYIWVYFLRQKSEVFENF